VYAAPEADTADAEGGDRRISRLQRLAGLGHLGRSGRNSDIVLVEDILSVEKLDVLERMRDGPYLAAFAGHDLPVDHLPGERGAQAREEVVVVVAGIRELGIVQVF